MADALESLGYGLGKNYAKVDLLGYHTGCLIAACSSWIEPTRSD